MLTMINTTEKVAVENTSLVESNCDDLISRWVNFVDRTPATAKAYTVAVKRFYSYLKDNNVTNPTRQDIINYRDEMTASLKPASVKLNLNAVKLFFKWLASEGFIPADISANIHTPRLDNSVHSRDALSATDASAVLAAMSTDDSEKSLRDKCIMTLMFCCGLRSVEVTRLDVADVERRGNKYCLRIWGKARSGKLDSVVLPKKCYELIQKYLSVRNLRGKIEKKAPLFVATSNRCTNARLETQSISRLAKAALRNAGYDSERLTCHSCRHTFANVALNAGVSLRDIQKTLRHMSSATTEIYLHDMAILNNASTTRVCDTILGGVF